MKAVFRCALVLVLSAASAGASQATEAQRSGSSDVISVRDGRMRVGLTDARVGSVIAEVARQAGAEVRGSLPDDRTVSASFDDVALEEGLRRILGDLSFATVYREDGRLRAIELRGGPQERMHAAGADKGEHLAAPASDDEEVARATEVLRTFALEGQPIPVRGRLARALGANAVPFQGLMEAAVRQADPEVRSEAVRAGLRAVESDRTVRDALTLVLGTMGDDSLVEIVRNMASDRAREFMDAIAREARTGTLRTRAHALAGLVAAPARVP